jgi:hypothetical protein
MREPGDFSRRRAAHARREAFARRRTGTRLLFSETKDTSQRRPGTFGPMMESDRLD